MMHRASVVREEVDTTAIRPTVNETTVYAALPCLLIPVSGRALRDEDRAVGNEVYKLLHVEGQLAVNDKVTVSDRNGATIRAEMFSGPTADGLVLNQTEMKNVAYGL